VVSEIIFSRVIVLGAYLLLFRLGMVYFSRGSSFLTIFFSIKGDTRLVSEVIGNRVAMINPRAKRIDPERINRNCFLWFCKNSKRDFTRFSIAEFCSDLIRNFL